MTMSFSCFRDTHENSQIDPKQNKIVPCNQNHHERFCKSVDNCQCYFTVSTV